MPQSVEVEVRAIPPFRDEAAEGWGNRFFMFSKDREKQAAGPSTPLRMTMRKTWILRSHPKRKVRV